MMSKEMDGKILSDEICDNLKIKCDNLKANKIYPELTILSNNKKYQAEEEIKRCKEIGIENHVLHIDCLDTIQYDTIITNCRNPIFIHNSIYDKVKFTHIANTIPTVFDMNGHSICNIGSLYVNSTPKFYSCIAAGIMNLLYKYNVSLSGKDVVVIKDNDIDSKLIATMLEHVGCTVTTFNDNIQENKLYEHIKNADIIISFVNRDNPITYDRANIITDYKINWINKVLIDNRYFSDELRNYCQFYATQKDIEAIAIAMLMKNVIKFYENNVDKAK